ncbi:MAG: hypothetical protein KBC84_02025 [Proteobacteria bacterium]|nr:hypothetical protein [Pseudomonadota bacterium]
MRKHFRFQLTIIFALIIFSSCSTWRKLNGTEKGAVVGGAVGAVGGGLIGHEHDEEKRR